MSRLVASLVAILFLGPCIASEPIFSTNASNSYCNRDYLFSGKKISVHKEPSNTSQVISTVKPKAGSKIEFERYDSKIITAMPGKGQFVEEPEYIVTTYYGDVDFIDFSKISHLPMTEDLKLQKGDKFEYLAHVEEEFGLIRLNGLVFMADLVNAEIWSKPQLEWWVKIASPHQGWIHLEEGSYSASKCKW